MVILVTGGSGLIGNRLITYLESLGHRVVSLVRSRERITEKSALWSTSTGYFDWDESVGIDAVVHLAGETILGRWSQAKKARIRDSRVDITRNLCEYLASLKSPPKTLVAASATGFYGDRGEESLSEKSLPGSGYLPSVCQLWEAATTPAVEAGIRVVNLRIGMVLTPEGGALASMLKPFRLGLGGKVGNGRQYMSWISREDLLAIIRYAVETEEFSGPVNAVSPQPVTNKEFTQVLGLAVNRPTLFSIPSLFVRLALGEMGKDVLLASAKVIPVRLQELSFPYCHTELSATLDDLLLRSLSD